MERVGAGPPPILTDAGWLVIYHGVNMPDTHAGLGEYSVGGILLDRQDPTKIVCRARTPLMIPEADFEREGYMPDVIFPTGIIQEREDLLIYYGAADSHICVARRNLHEILKLISNGC
ncbi:hypothetical protein ACFLU6_15040 [Acidobacteriota bacterium]